MAVRSWILLLLCCFFPLACTSPVQQQVDSLICDRAALNFDEPTGKDDKPAKMEKTRQEANPNGVQQASFLESSQPGEPKKTSLLDRLIVPDKQNARVPGAEADEIKWFGPKATPEEKKKIADKYFPPLPPLPKDPELDFPPGPDGKPLRLKDLQRIAYSNSPQLRQAASDIEAARGNAIQAGVYPNPILSYTSTAVSYTSGSIMGPSLNQTIVTMGKKKLAQDSAVQDLRAAEFAYRRAETDLMANVRANFYAVLVAQESVRANRGLAQLTDECYRVLRDLAGAGEYAPYEPAQLAVFSGQARSALVTARNQQMLAWRQLAAALGAPHMPATALEGNVYRRMPKLDFEKALAHVLAKHTDVATAAAGLQKARYNLRLAQVMPVPDVTVGANLLYDGTPPGPSRFIPGVTASIPVPIFDRNQGGIMQAQAALMRAVEQPHAVQTNLTYTFADAYRRYDENRILLDMYQRDILPKQVQAFRTAVKRHFGGEVGAVAFYDLVTSEQNLVTVVGAYLPILSAHWQAVCDVSSLLQTDQLYQMADEMTGESAVDFAELLKMPCHHLCSPVMPEATPQSFAQPPTAGPLLPPSVAPKMSSTVVPVLAPVVLPRLESGNVQAREVIRVSFAPLDGSAK